jgi:hypothetical protein
MGADVAGECRADGVCPLPVDDSSVERLLSAFEERVSYAVGHGRAPLEVTITRSESICVLEVSDAETDQPPTPAVGQDAAAGGLGPHLVAQASGAHGWLVSRGLKAGLGADHDPPQTAAAPAPVPVPRTPVTDDHVGR